MIYAIDFDGTLCKSLFPKIGYENTDIINYVKSLSENGNEIILWTCREDEKLKDAIDWCAERGLVFDYINENTPEVIEEYGGNCRKIHADYYLDDKSLSPSDVLSEIEGAKAELNKLKAYKSF